MRSHIEKAMALIRQGQSMKALRVLSGILQTLPLEETDDEDTGEITLELAIPMEFPSVEIEMVVDGTHFLVIDQEDEWIIGHKEVLELNALCSAFEHRRYMDVSEVNVYKMSVAAKIKEMVLCERVVKR